MIKLVAFILGIIAAVPALAAPPPRMLGLNDVAGALGYTPVSPTTLSNGMASAQAQMLSALLDGTRSLLVSQAQVLLNGNKRTLATSDVINVMDYGAKCDNAVTDDTAAFTSAINAALARTTGATIVVPAGRCMLSAALNIPISNQQAVNFVGAGQDITDLVWSNDVNGIVVTFSGVDTWQHTAAAPAPVFHIDGMSLVYNGTTGLGNGAALILNGQTTRVSGGINPDVNVTNLGVHAATNSAQSWKNGIYATGLPSALKITRVNLVGGNTGPPYTAATNGIHLNGGTTIGGDGHTTNISAPYTLDEVTAVNWDHGVDIGQGVQGVYINRLQSVANWPVYASQPTANGDTGTISINASNPLGVKGCFYASNISYLWFTNNQCQTGNNAGTYNGLELHNGGQFVVTGNTFVGATVFPLSGPQGATAGVTMDSLTTPDTVGNYNTQLIAHNEFLLLSTGVNIGATRKNTMVIGNHFTAVTTPYVLAPDNTAVSNMINGAFEAYNSVNHAAQFNSDITTSSTLNAVNVVAANVNVTGVYILPRYPVSGMPACTAAFAGRAVMASNGRNAGEGAGAGTGVVAYCTTAGAWLANGAALAQ